MPQVTLQQPFFLASAIIPSAAAELMQAICTLQPVSLASITARDTAISSAEAGIPPTPIIREMRPWLTEPLPTKELSLDESISRLSRLLHSIIISLKSEGSDIGETRSLYMLPSELAIFSGETG